MPQKKSEDKECYVIPSPRLRTRPFVIMGEKMSPEEMDCFLGVTKEVKPVVKSENDEIVVTQVKQTPVKNEVVVTHVKQTPVKMKSEIKVSDSSMKKKIHNPYLKSPKSGMKNPYQKAKVIDLSLEEQKIVKLKHNSVPVNTPFPFGEHNNKKPKKSDSSIFSNGGNVYNNCVFHF